MLSLPEFTLEEHAARHSVVDIEYVEDVSSTLDYVRKPLKFDMSPIKSEGPYIEVQRNRATLVEGMLLHDERH